MSMIDLKAQESYNYSTNCFYRDSQQQILLLGPEKTIYLFFSLPVWLCDFVLLEARLILFKLPYDASNTMYAANTADRYTLCPLREIFNVYGYMYAPPSVDLSRCVAFRDLCGQSYTEIDITRIMKDWSGGELENNGLLLMGRGAASYLCYASSQYGMSAMRPMLRLTCQNAKPFCTLRTVACDVAVSRPV